MVTPTSAAPKPSAALFQRRSVTVTAALAEAASYQPPKSWATLEATLAHLSGRDERLEAAKAKAARHQQAMSYLEVARRQTVRSASESLGGHDQYATFLLWLDKKRQQVASALRRPTLRQEFTDEEITQRFEALEHVSSLVMIFRAGIALH